MGPAFCHIWMKNKRLLIMYNCGKAVGGRLWQFGNKKSLELEANYCTTLLLYVIITKTICNIFQTQTNEISLKTKAKSE